MNAGISSNVCDSKFPLFKLSQKVTASSALDFESPPASRLALLLLAVGPGSPEH